MVEISKTGSERALAGQPARATRRHGWSRASWSRDSIARRPRPSMIVSCFLGGCQTLRI